MNQIKTIHIGADHAGYELKEDLREFLESLGFDVVDHGAFEYDEDDDYPEFCATVAKAVLADEDKRSRGIVIGGSGQGEAIAANRFPGIRAVVYYGEPNENRTEESIISLSRLHNDANVLSLGARFLNLDDVREVVETWVTLPFSEEERHIRRNNSLDTLD